jgi:hypothetical protein
MILDDPTVLVRRLVTVAVKSEVSTQNGCPPQAPVLFGCLPDSDAVVLKSFGLAPQTEAGESPQHQASKIMAKVRWLLFSWRSIGLLLSKAYSKRREFDGPTGRPSVA